MISPIKCFSRRIVIIRHIVGIVVLLFVVTNVFYTSTYVAIKLLNAKQLTMNSTSKHIAIDRFKAEHLTMNSSPRYSKTKRLKTKRLAKNSSSTCSAINRLNAKQLTKSSTLSTPYPPTTHCPWLLNMTRRKRNYVPTPVETPWASLLANYSDAIASGRNLYVWSCNPQQIRKFGNQLFNFAAVFGVAWYSKRIPLWTKRRTHVSAFKHRLVIDSRSQRFKRETNRTSFKERASGVYDNRTENLPKRNICLIEFTQSYKYFYRVEDQLRVDLTFQRSILRVARRWLEQVAPAEWEGQDFVRVVIHVRRGDYMNKAHIREGWTRPSLDYFRRAMSYFTDCLERVQFVIMSDEIGWCREHLSWSNVVFSIRHSAAVDLAIASLCDHAIVTIGSYSWWAAWFTNGVVITNKEVPRPCSILSRRIHREDYYKPDWIAL